MRIDKLKATHETLERMANRLLIDKEIDAKTYFAGIIAILKELIDSEIETEKLKGSMFT